MKTFLKFFILAFIITLAPQLLSAQQSVQKAKKEAEKLYRKVTKRQFKKFKTDYPKALWAISVIEQNAPNAPFGYDQLADKIPEWIALNDVLEQFPDYKISYKGQTIQLQVKNYRPLLKTARKKAAKAHMEAALQIIRNTSDFEARKKALGHFDKVRKYSDDYQAEINRESAKIYYDEGARLASADNLKALTSAIQYLEKATQYVSGYRNSRELLQNIRNKGATLAYEAAVRQENEGTFDAEKEAARLYSQADQWVPGYRDAKEKAQTARVRATVDVVVINRKGYAINPDSIPDDIRDKTNDYILFPDYHNLLKNVNLKYRDNYGLAARKTGRGFILIKPESPSDYNLFEYSQPAPQTSSRKYVVYTQQVFQNGKYQDKVISESQFNVLQKKKAKGLTKHIGYFKIIVYQSELKATKLLKIWDVRNPQHPRLIETIPLQHNFKSTMTHVYFTGDKLAKPDSVKTGVTGQFLDKQELIRKYNEMPVTLWLKVCPDKLASILNKEIAYRELSLTRE